MISQAESAFVSDQALANARETLRVATQKAQKRQEAEDVCIKATDGEDIEALSASIEQAEEVGVCEKFVMAGKQKLAALEKQGLAAPAVDEMEKALAAPVVDEAEKVPVPVDDKTDTAAVVAAVADTMAEVKPVEVIEKPPNQFDGPEESQNTAKSEPETHDKSNAPLGVVASPQVTMAEVKPVEVVEKPPNQLDGPGESQNTAKREPEIIASSSSGTPVLETTNDGTRRATEVAGDRVDVESKSVEAGHLFNSLLWWRRSLQYGI